MKAPGLTGALSARLFSCMARHHYVPQFLLREWATNGRLTAYYFETASGKVIENARPPSGGCQEAA